jgi:hypothetical protein
MERYLIWTENRPGVWESHSKVSAPNPASAAVKGLQWIIKNFDPDVDVLRIAAVKGPQSAVSSITIYNFRQVGPTKFQVYPAGHRQFARPARFKSGQLHYSLVQLGQKSPTKIYKVKMT